MIQSPLKKKYTNQLSTSRGNRTSYYEQLTATSKSPFRCQTDHVIKCTQLEQELHRVNQQRKLIALELSDISSQYIKKCKQLEESEQMNTILQEKLQQSRHTEEITKMHQLLKQKNQIILEWTNRFHQLERRLEQDSNYEGMLKQSEIQYELQKEQLLELKMQLKVMQENYRDLREEKTALSQKYVETQVELEKGSIKDHKIKFLECEKDQLLKELESIKAQLLLRRDKKHQISEKEEKMKQRISELEHVEKQAAHLEQKKQKWKQKYKILLEQKEFSDQKCQHDDQIAELMDKVQQLDMENTYLREQNMDMQNKYQNLTDKILKQQLQNSYSKEQSSHFSFQEANKANESQSEGQSEQQSIES